MKPRIYSYFNLTLAMFISGSAVVVSKLMVSRLPTFLATELGILIGMLIMVPLTFLIKKENYKINLKTHVVLFLQALCGILLYRLFTFIGLNYTSAANSGLITSAAPVLVVIIAMVFLKEKMTTLKMLGTLLVVTGLFIINYYSYISNGTTYNTMKGNVLIFAAVICEAIFSVLSKVKCMKMSPIFRTTMLVIYAFIMLLPFAIYDAINFEWNTLNGKTLACVLYYGIFVSYLSYVFWFRGIEKIQASNAAVFTSIVPMSSVLLSAIILRETLSWMHIISLVIIMIGIMISSTEGIKRKAILYNQ